MKKIPANFGYERTKRVAKSIYKKIVKVTCPILDSEEIHFNANGFGHLIRKSKASCMIIFVTKISNFEVEVI